MIGIDLSLATIYPNSEIFINGQRNQNLAADVQSITVTEDLEAPSMVAIQLNNYDILTQQFTWSESSQLNPGAEIKIKMGYDNKLNTVIVGEITGLEPEFSGDHAPSLVVRGHDRRHRLLRGTHSHSFVMMKDSEIARQIALRNGLSAEVTDTKVKLEYVLQNNQSDLAFLQTRSQRIGYEVWIEGKTLHFQPPQHRTLSTMRLQFGEELIEFLPRLSLLNQLPQLEVRGWDRKKQKGFIGKSATATVPLMSGTKAGVGISKAAFGQTRHQVVNQPPQDQAEADQMAKGQFEEMSLDYITGEGLCVGNSKIRAGTVVEISGVGKRFSGRYYVSAVTHLFSMDEMGYRTEFTVRRTAS
jgi:uncharacterized protein